MTDNKPPLKDSKEFKDLKEFVAAAKAGDVRNIFAIAMLAAIIVFVGWALISNDSNERSGDDNLSEMSALLICQDAVEAQLKSPSTAEIVDNGRTLESSAGNNTWRITGTVDAQNSFGAMIRSNFDCTVRGSGSSTGTVSNLSID